MRGQDEGAERGRRAREDTGGGASMKETDKSAGSDEAAK